MKRSSGPRKTANLSESVHQRLNMYAMSAAAAGVGLLALMQAAQAKIVYTPADKPLRLNHLFYLDLNHDGRNDFKFLLHSTRQPCCFTSLKVEGLRQGNKILSAGTSFNLPCAAALPKGMTVGPKSPFQKGYLDMFWASGSTFGGGLSGCPWFDMTQAYLGMRFSINGQVHYGWARFGNVSFIKKTATLTGYAFETIPGKPIIAGATKSPDDAEPTASLNPPTPVPATLGALAMGAPGLSIWRREESVGAIS
jgi:hypothetical protein